MAIFLSRLRKALCVFANSRYFFIPAPGMAALLLLVFLALPQKANGAGDGPGANTTLLLPALVVTDEAGESLGINGYWGGVFSTGWDALITGAYSSSYSRTQFDFFAINRSLGDLWYAELQGGYLSANRSLFYDYGNQSSLNGRADYGVTRKRIGGAFGLSLGGLFYEGIGLLREDTTIGPGADGSILDVPDAYPGMARLYGTQLTSWYLFVKFDSRRPVYDSNTGDMASIRWEISQGYLSSGLGLQRFSFEATHYQSLESLLPKMLGVFHGEFERLWGDDIPFYLHTRLGGQEGMRSFMPGRWSDRGKMLLSAEFRYTFADGGGTFKRFDIVPFWEMGKVVGGESMYSLSNMAFTYGVGIIGALSNGLPLRLDFATGAEGTLAYLHLLNGF